MNTLEGYLDHSPRLGEQFVLFLDALITDDSLIEQVRFGEKIVLFLDALSTDDSVIAQVWLLLGEQLVCSWMLSSLMIVL